MSFITQDYKLNLIPGIAPVVVHASQYDKGSRTLNFSLFNGSTEIANIAALGVASAEIVGTKPDRKGFQFPATLGTATVSVVIEEQMTAVAGNVVCEIRFLDASDDVLGTANFILRVEPSALADDVDISKTVLPGYIDGAQRAARQAEESATTAAESAEAATLAGAAATAAAESAEQDAQTASTAATTASEAATAAGTSATQAAQSAEAAADSEAWAVGQKNGVDVPSSAPQYQNNAKYYAGKAMEGTPEGYAAMVEEIGANQNGGFLRKNLLPRLHGNTTNNGITFTVNSDSSITANGTASGNYAYYTLTAFEESPDFPAGSYILSGCPSGGSSSSYRIVASRMVDGGTPTTVSDYGDGLSFESSGTFKVNVYLRIENGQTVNDLTFYPMIRSASIADGTYVPYVKSNYENQQEITESENAGFLQKNLLPNGLTTTTNNGVTFTVNDDGSVTLNGTSTGGSAVFDLPIDTLKVGQSYTASGIAGGSTATYQVYLQNAEGLSTPVGNFGNGEKTWTQAEGSLVGRYRIRVANGATVDNVTIYPMIRPAEITDGTYVPYAPSNVELRNAINNESKSLFARVDLSNGTDLNGLMAYGEYVARSNATAASLVNAPMASAFRLTVESSRSETDTTNVRQTAYSYYREDIYSRVTIDGGVTWTAWTKHAMGDTVPTNHAAAATTYGSGTATNYGHVKLSDDYATSGGAAEDGVAASSKALNDAYNELKASAGNTAYVANGASQILMDGNDVAVTFVHWAAILDGDLTAGESAISNTPIRAEVIEMIGTAPFTASIVSNKLTITATANIWVTWETILQE